VGLEWRTQMVAGEQCREDQTGNEWGGPARLSTPKAGSFWMRQADGMSDPKDGAVDAAG